MVEGPWAWKQLPLPSGGCQPGCRAAGLHSQAAKAAGTPSSTTGLNIAGDCRQAAVGGHGTSAARRRHQHLKLTPSPACRGQLFSCLPSTHLLPLPPAHPIALPPASSPPGFKRFLPLLRNKTACGSSPSCPPRRTSHRRGALRPTLPRSPWQQKQQQRRPVRLSGLSQAAAAAAACSHLTCAPCWPPSTSSSRTCTVCAMGG